MPKMKTIPVLALNSVVTFTVTVTVPTSFPEGNLINTRVYKNDKEISCSGNCKDFMSYVDFF